MVWRSRNTTVESTTRPRRTRMTITVGQSSCPNVFDAGLPAINYEHAQHPDEAHAVIHQAREKAPIARRSAAWSETALSSVSITEISSTTKCW